MNSRPATALFAALALLVTLWSIPVAQGAPAIAHFTLANGLEVVVIPDRRVPVVTHMVWYRVGAADETPGLSGLAHLLEHLMFKGTAANPDGLFSRTVSNLGGRENAFTSSDYTGYYQRVPREHLRRMMELEADRMTGLVLTDEVVKPELDVVLEEYNMRVANSPDARLQEQMSAALYLNHPYGRPVIGWRREIEKLTRADALAFYKRFYTPNNAILVVAGDVSADEVRVMAEQTYGKVARRIEIHPRQRPMEPTPAAERSVKLADPRVTQPSVRRFYLVPSTRSAGPGESEALDVLAHVVGGGANSRLYRALVVEQGIAVNAGAWYSGSGLDYSEFGVVGSPRPGVPLSQVEQAMDAVLAEVAANGVTEDELTRSKNRLVADAVYAQDSQSTLARWYGAGLASGLSVDDIRSRPDRIREVTADAVREAAVKWLDRRRSVTGYLVKDETKVSAPDAPPRGAMPAAKREEKRS